jgi:hypothetical protein
VSPELRQALRVVAEAMAPGAAVPVPRETLLELLAAPTAEPDDYTVAEAAAILHRSPGTVRLWCSTGAIPDAVRWRRKEWRIPRAKLEEFRRAGPQAGQDAPAPTAPADLGSWRAHLQRAS